MRIGRKPQQPAVRRRLRDSLQQPDRSVNKTFSYSSRRSEAAFNTGRQLQRELKDSAAKSLRFGLQRFGLIVLMLAVIFSAVNVLTLSPKVRVEPLVTNSQDVFLRPKADYEQFAGQQLSASVWNHNKLTVNTDDVSQKLLAKFPELSSASVTVPLLAQRPIVYVQPAEPALVLVARNGAFVVSDSGKALIRSNDASSLNQPSLPEVKDLSSLKLELGRQALPNDSVAFIRNVVAQFAASKITISGMTLPANTSELDVQPAGQPYIVKFNLHSDKPRQQAGTYLATIQALQKQGVTPGKYVDVRVDGRAYYQ